MSLCIYQDIRNKNMHAIISHYYADLPVGTAGEVKKSWTDPNGCNWHKLFLGVNRSGKRLYKSVPEDCLKLFQPFVSSHKLDFEVADWHGCDDIKLYRIGTCEGQYTWAPGYYAIVSVINKKPGNGHLDDVFEWFENSCRRDKKALMVLELMNPRFYQHLVEKRGFVPAGGDNLIKTFI